MYDAGEGLQSSRPRQWGFTLVELMVTLAVVVIFALMAAPLFVEMRERSIVRGAAGDLVAAVAQAKFEAAKRNSFVTVSIRGSGSAWCIGVQTTATGCNCLNSTCDISQFNTSDLNRAKLLAPASFNSAATTDFTIDPRLGMLRNLDTGGTLVVRSPSDTWDYRLQFNLSPTAQTKLCTPTGGKHALSDYPSC